MGVFCKILLLLIFLVAAPAAAVAQAGYIGLYADPAGTVCNVSDRGGGEVKVYVIHKATSGAAASQWKIASDDGFAMTYVGETWSTAAMGNTQSGVSASYGSCLASPVLLCTVTYMSHGASASCSSLQVVPDPASVSGTIEVVDCASHRLSGTGDRLVVNPDGSCPCGHANNVQETDWGRIKAMFSQ